VAKDTLLAPRYSPAPGYWDDHPLDPAIAAIADGSFHDKEPPIIRGTGYVVDALEAALWAFDRSDNFQHGCLLAVNLGDDADTTAAIYGQLAGAYYGASGIPEAWRKKIVRGEEISELALRLHAAAT
jgi:ADP-ribosylglycohydrolase